MYERTAELDRRLLTPRGYSTVFNRIERTLNDLRLILTNSTRSYHDLSWVSTEQAAQDVVDLAICGTMSQVLSDFGIGDRLEKAGAPYYWQHREQFHATRRRQARRRRPKRTV